MTNPQIARAILNQALGFSDRKNYEARLAEGFEWCKRWLLATNDRNNIDFDDGVWDELRRMCDANAAH